MAYCNISHLYMSVEDAEAAIVWAERARELARRIVAFWDGYDLLLTPTLAQPPVPIGSLHDDDPWQELRNVGRFVPFTLFGLAAGVVADRFESRKLVMTTQAAAMVISVALAVVTLTDTATLPIVYALAALGGIALAFDAPGRQSLTFQMVGPRELPNAVALNSGLFNGSRVIGPAIAGLVIAALLGLPGHAAVAAIALVMLAGAWEWAVFAGLTSTAGRVGYVALVAVTIALLWTASGDGSKLRAILVLTMLWWLAGLLWLLFASHRGGRVAAPAAG